MRKAVIWIRRVVSLLLAAAAIWLVYYILNTRHGLHMAHHNVRQLSELLKSFGPMAYVLGAGAVVLQVIVPFVPFVLVAGANVLAFGLVTGFLINYSMAVTGAILSFLFSRYIGRRWVERKIASYPLVLEFNKRLEDRGFFFVLIGRLIPIIPSSAINLGAGVTKIRFRSFLFGTVFGKLPIVLLESYIGNDLFYIRQHKGRLLLLLALLGALILIGSLLKKKLLPPKSTSEEEEIL